MKPIEIGKGYKLKNGERCVVVGAECEMSEYERDPIIKPIHVYEIRKEDGNVYKVCESSLESEDAQ